jgi:hypothetical protein
MYAYIDDAGDILGFETEPIEKETCVEISDEIWASHISGEHYRYINGKWVPKQPTPGEEKRKSKRAVNDMADRKTAAAKAYLAGKTYVSPEQQDRYARKYDVAKAYLGTKDDQLKALLTPEADGAGMSVDDLAALIVQMGDQWRQAVQAYAVMIDGARVALNRLIDAGKLEGVRTALDELGALGADATPDEIKAIIDKAAKS